MIVLHNSSLLIWGITDDLVATGGTLIAACDLLSSVGATIVECACMVELKMLGGYQKLQAKHPGVKVTAFSTLTYPLCLTDTDLLFRCLMTLISSQFREICFSHYKY